MGRNTSSQHLRISEGGRGCISTGMFDFLSQDICSGNTTFDCIVKGQKWKSNIAVVLTQPSLYGHLEEKHTAWISKLTPGHTSGYMVQEGCRRVSEWR